MFKFEVNQINYEDKYIYNCDYLSILYVTDGEVQVFHHTLNKLSHLKEGNFSIVPCDEHSYINAFSGSVCIITLSNFLVFTFANNLYPQLLGIDYSNLSYIDHYSIINDHLKHLTKHSPYDGSSLNSETSYSIITILNMLSKSINDKVNLTDQKIKTENNSYAYEKCSTVVRLFKASVELLNYPQKSIAHIAIDYGFCDQAHFTKLFKKHRNMTPRLFRQRYAYYKTINND